LFLFALLQYRKQKVVEQNTFVPSVLAVPPMVSEIKVGGVCVGFD
jgi:hypothetical protein